MATWPKSAQPITVTRGFLLNRKILSIVLIVLVLTPGMAHIAGGKGATGGQAEGHRGRKGKFLEHGHLSFLSHSAGVVAEEPVSEVLP